MMIYFLFFYIIFFAITPLLFFPFLILSRPTRVPTPYLICLIELPQYAHTLFIPRGCFLLHTITPRTRNNSASIINNNATSTIAISIFHNYEWTYHEFTKLLRPKSMRCERRYKKKHCRIPKQALSLLYELITSVLCFFQSLSLTRTAFLRYSIRYHPWMGPQ